MADAPQGARAEGPWRDNAFDAIRLLAAFAVLVGHAWPLTGASHPSRLAGLPIWEFGVDVFFALSGFLIATSWARSPRVLPFLTRRVFRIFPALIVVVVLWVFVLGPTFSTLPAGEYFADAGSWAYLSGIVLAPTYRLPGVFIGNPVDGVVNGSLWTLGPEFLCYLVVVAIGLLALTVGARRPELRRLVAFAAIGVGIAVLLLIPDVVPRGVGDTLRLVVFFAAGAVLAELDRLGLLAPARRLRFVLPVTVAWLVAGALVPDAARVIAWVALPFVVIGLGSHAIPVARRAARFGDLSYGIYVWAYPVQQVVVAALPDIPLAVDILLVAAITSVLALGSWWAIERRAIDLGRRLSSSSTRLSAPTARPRSP